MNNMDYKETMIKFVGRLMDRSIFWKLPLMVLSGCMCASSYANERFIDRDDPLFKEVERSFKEPIKEARIRTSDFGIVTGITAYVGPVASYLRMEGITNDVLAPSYQSILKALGTQNLPGEAAYKGVAEIEKIKGEGKAYAAVYEGMGNEPKALIILTKSDEPYSVAIKLSLSYLLRGKSLLRKLERHRSAEKDAREAEEREQVVNCKSSCLGQYDGWRVYVCPDGGANGDYIAGRKDYPDHERYEVVCETISLSISCKDGTRFWSAIIKCMDYKLVIQGRAADSIRGLCIPPPLKQ